MWILSEFQVFMESGHIPPKLELEGEGRGERPVSERILFKSPTSSIQPFPTLVTRPSNQSDYDDNDDDDDDYDDDDYDPSTPVFPFFPTLVSRPSNQSNLRVPVIIAPLIYILIIIFFTIVKRIYSPNLKKNFCFGHNIHIFKKDQVLGKKGEIREYQKKLL